MSARRMVTGVALLVVAAPAAARAADKGHKACVDAYKEANKQERASRLREAIKSFTTCSQPICGVVLRRECLLRYSQLQADIPSVVPVVTDATGEPLMDVKVSMDGEVLTSRIDGRAVAVDPGLHEFSFATPAGTATQKIVILQGQRNRPITVSVAAGKNGPPRVAIAAGPAPIVGQSDSPSVVEPTPISITPPPAARPEDLIATPAAVDTGSSRRRHSVASYLFSGVAVAGVGTYALFTYWGRKDNEMLVRCKPNCIQTDVDHVRKLYTTANVALGVGAAALVGATWMFLHEGAVRRREEAARRSSIALDVVPVPAGAVAGVRGGF
jgi:hypothetical protein